MRGYLSSQLLCSVYEDNMGKKEHQQQEEEMLTEGPSQKGFCNTIQMPHTVRATCEVVIL